MAPSVRSVIHALLPAQLPSWRALASFFAALLGLVATLPAHAVPAFARQTGVDCASCHVGGYGPQLTPFGVQFKLSGYTETNGQPGQVPLSGMLVANWSHSSKALSEVPDGFHANNNSAVQEASVFLAGRLAQYLGSFTQSTYSGVDKRWALDQVDLRYARPVQIGSKEAIAGVSLNTNPTLTDPLNTLGQWRFPYTSSDFGFGQGPTPIVENLASGVLGVNAYALWDQHLYGEIGLYGSPSASMLSAINADDPGKLKGPGLYWRLAYLKDRRRDNFSVGLVGFHAGLQPDRSQLGVADHYDDLGIDASYQFLGTREHIFTANASYMHERQVLDYTFASEGADRARHSLDSLRLALSYHYRQTWGLTGSLFSSRGSADQALYGASAYNGRPDTSGYVLQADWTPWGKEDSWAAPWANVRVGLQYTGYNRFNGGSHYLDTASGTDRKASDNNTTMLFVWTSF